jgi:mannose-1-phosphate guanylyltransferase
MFIEMMIDAGKLAVKEQKYVTGGIKPSFPVMGVDYLVKGERVSANDDVGIYRVDKFIWRSTKKDTEKLIQQEGALIHTNHSCMTPSAMLAMLQKYKPEWHEPLMNFINGADLLEEYSKMPPGPIEEVTEKVHQAGESLVVELPFEWYDIGTFEMLHEYLKLKGLDVVRDNVINIDSNNNYVSLNDENKVVALVGVKDLIVVDTGDVLLVCNKKNNSDVKQALEEVKSRKLSLT